MCTGMRVCFVLISVILVGHCSCVSAADAVSGTTTLWQFIGIPQGINKVTDATVNHSGNRPGLERKPVLKKIADPANLESPNPAIKEAAAIKIQEDLKKQKIKAIKYLADVGCGCYPGVKESLLAALDDCTEDVREQAALAFCHAAGSPCCNCNNAGCCSADVMTKLHEVAYGKDARGCFIESSSKVRQAAAGALNACRRVRGSDTYVEPQPTPAPQDGKEVGEEPMPGGKETGADQPYPTPETPGPSVTTAPGPGGEAGSDTDLGTDFSPSPYDMASNVGGVSGPMGIPSMIGDQFGFGSDPSVVVRRFYFSELGHESGAGLFYTTQDGTRVALSYDAEGHFDPGTQTWSYPIRDYNDETGKLGGAPLECVPADGTLVDGTTTNNDNPHTSNFRVRYLVSVPSPTENVGRMKIAENTSPIPRDRLIFNYSYFDNTQLGPGGVNVSRYTLGFEKTFSQKTASIEFKMPLLTTFNSTQVHAAPPSMSHYEFGNISVTFKKMLLLRKTWGLSMGLQIATPTADDSRLNTKDGTTLVRIDNQSVHLEPFVGGVWAPTERFFTQFFAQWDVDANGNQTLVNPTSTGQNLVYAGRMQDPTYQYIDISAGYWLRRDRQCRRRLTGVAALAELHWNRSLQSTDVITSDQFVIGSLKNDQEVFNLTLGCFFEFQKHTTVLVGYSTPLGGGNDQQFDGELRLLFNRRFGPTTRVTRTPF